MNSATLPSTLPSTRKAPWRLLAFVGIALGMGGLVHLQPSLADSYGVLAALCAAFGITSLAFIEWLPELKKGQAAGPFSFRDPERPAGWSMTSAEVTNRPSAPAQAEVQGPERLELGRNFRFVLDSFARSAKVENQEEIQRLAHEIGQAWHQCFVEHREIVVSALRPRGRSPLQIVLWESEPIVGALLGSAFEEVGYRVLRMPAGNLRGPTRGFFIQYRRDLPFASRDLDTSADDSDSNLQDLVPVEDIPSSPLLQDDRLTPRQLEVVSASLGHFFEKTLEVAQAQGRLHRPPQH